jgi:hypothetical protein
MTLAAQLAVLNGKVDELSRLLREQLHSELCLQEGAAILRLEVEHLQAEKVEMLAQIQRMWAEQKLKEESDGELLEATHEVIQRQRDSIANLEVMNGTLQSEADDLNKKLAEVRCFTSHGPGYCDFKLRRGTLVIADVSAGVHLPTR